MLSFSRLGGVIDFMEGEKKNPELVRRLCEGREQLRVKSFSSLARESLI